MQSRPLHPTDEASLDSILASAGRNRSDFIDLNPELGHGRLLHRRLPPPGGMAHFHVSDDLDILLEFTDAEWPRICAAVGGDPPDGVEPVGSYQQPLITELTTPLVSFQDTGLRRRVENHPVVACHCIDGNAHYPDWVWVHYILRINQLTWAEVLLCHDRNDKPFKVVEAYADDGDLGRRYVGRWSGWYLDAPGVLRWFVDYHQTPPAGLLVDLLNHAVIFAPRPSRQGAVPGHGPEPEERSGAAQRSPADDVVTHQNEHDELPDGPFGLNEFRWRGQVIRLIGGIPFRYLSTAWQKAGRTLDHDDIAAAHDDRNLQPEWGAVKGIMSRMNKAFEQAGLPFRFRCNQNLFRVVLRESAD